MTQVFDTTMQGIIVPKLEALEKYFNADCIFYCGSIYASQYSFDKLFKDFIENLVKENRYKKKLCVLLNTPGGVVETVEKMVRMIRFHYEDVSFIIPNQAMSAGTVFCMSGNKIYMDYSSSLGPIDPQIINKEGMLVPALGYLDEVDSMIKKSREGKLSSIETLILQSLDLAQLNRYKQARELTITLLKEWLVKYKFANWKTHRNNLSKKDQAVTEDEKMKRAEEIAKKLSDNKFWHSHARMIDINVLKNDLKLEIEDYSKNEELKNLIGQYNDLVLDFFIERKKVNFFLHSRNFNFFQKNYRNE